MDTLKPLFSDVLHLFFCCRKQTVTVYVCVCVSALASDSIVCLSVLHRETWNLNPPEVRNAQLQYAGWGPQGQQLVSTTISTKSLLPSLPADP